METKPTCALRIRTCRTRWGHRIREGELCLEQAGTFPINHVSTRLALELLARACQEQQPAALLDVGCGSGILALAGALLGIPLVVGCDLLARAVRVSQRNSRRHDLPGRVLWFQGSTEAVGRSFPLVIANLPAAVQVAKQAEFARLVASPGGLILAGFKEVRFEEVCGFYRQLGWRLAARLARDQWEPEPPPDLSYTWTGCYFQRPGG